jgi:hypothetical protein
MKGVSFLFLCWGLRGRCPLMGDSVLVNIFIYYKFIFIFKRGNYSPLDPWCEKINRKTAFLILNDVYYLTYAFT